jgi:Tfp pilus assembly protein PilF
MMRRKAWIVLLAASCLLGACVQPVQVAVSDLKERPGERALLAGLRAYEDAQYAEAEKLLTDALKTGLTAGRDTANANKYLAFIYCTSEREKLCEAAFRAARKADAQFTLSRAETGHPMWGPVYRRVQTAPQ